MLTGELERQLIGYSWEGDALTTILAEFTAEQILTALEAVLVEAEPTEVSVALSFLRDGIQIARNEALRTAYFGSSLLGEIRAAIYDDRRVVRHNAVYTLGKLGPRANSPLLRAALPWYDQHDPLGLDGVLFERAMTSGERAHYEEADLRPLARSPRWPTRWCTVGILWERLLDQAGQTYGWPVRLLRELAQDPHPRIAADAGAALDERRRRRVAKATSHRRHLRSRGPWATEPRRFFLAVDTVAIQVDSFLMAVGNPPYDEKTFTAVADHVEAHPLRGETDRDTYWMPVIATLARP